jgi:putative transcriptional regulator
MKITPIRLKRLNAGVDTKIAAQKLGIKRSTVYKIERGLVKPSRDLILRMSKLYGCSTDEIFKDLRR